MAGTFSVGQVATAAALNAVTLSNVTTYVPAVTNGGSATFTTDTGWYYQVGSTLVFFTAYLVVNVAGSGTSAISVSAPVNIDRTTRQIVSGHMEIASGSVNTNLAPISAIAFATGEGGSGNTFDRIRGETTLGSLNIRGQDLTAAAILTLTGWYRQA